MDKNAKLKRLSEQIEELNRKHFKTIIELKLCGHGRGSKEYDSAYERFSKKVMEATASCKLDDE